ncbi:hypothetical protein ACFL6N_00280 [Thermodesulfobacteriota bacterium]
MRKSFSFVLVVCFVLGFVTPTFASETIHVWFPPGWSKKAPKALAISKSLAKHSGLNIKPKIAKSYPDILETFVNSDDNELVYVGSFVQAIIKARAIGTPLVQATNGKEFYSGVMLYPINENPEEILKNYPYQVAYAVGASSGESSAKAATNGKASVDTSNHKNSAMAVLTGKAKAAFVKNWWWEANKARYTKLAMYRVPSVSIEKNPDNILTISKNTPVEIIQKITEAAIASKDVFSAQAMVELDTSILDFSLDLMKKGRIDPLTYSW